MFGSYIAVLCLRAASLVPSLHPPFSAQNRAQVYFCLLQCRFTVFSALHLKSPPANSIANALPSSTLPKLAAASHNHPKPNVEQKKTDLTNLSLAASHGVACGNPTTAPTTLSSPPWRRASNIHGLDVLGVLAFAKTKARAKTSETTDEATSLPSDNVAI